MSLGADDGRASLLLQKKSLSFRLFRRGSASARNVADAIQPDKLSWDDLSTDSASNGSSDDDMDGRNLRTVTDTSVQNDNGQMTVTCNAKPVCSKPKGDTAISTSPFALNSEQNPRMGGFSRTSPERSFVACTARDISNKQTELLARSGSESQLKKQSSEPDIVDRVRARRVQKQSSLRHLRKEKQGLVTANEQWLSTRRSSRQLRRTSTSSSISDNQETPSQDCTEIDLDERTQERRKRLASMVANHRRSSIC